MKLVKVAVAIAALISSYAGLAAGQQQADANTSSDTASTSSVPLPSVSVQPGHGDQSTQKIASNDSAASRGERAGGNRLVEEVIVTAQKREEAIQDVPISISAFTADQLDAQGVVTADGLARVTPGMTFTKVGGFSLIYLRGIGTDAFLPGADQTVPQYIDGVNVIGSQGSQYELGRVKRIEVLKGPQGTLFGRNSTGGAVNIITPDPSATFEGDATVEFGNYDTTNYKAFLNLPIVDGLGMTVSGFNNEHHEYYTNAAGPLFNPTYQRGAQSKLRWEPADNLSFTLFGLASKSKVSDSLITENDLPTPILGASIPADHLDRVAHDNVLPGSKTHTWLLSGTADWTIATIETKLIGSTQRYSSPFNQYDFDGSAQALVSFYVPKQFADQKTLELQFLSTKDTPLADTFEWVAGAYYLQGRGGFQQLNLQVAKSVLATPIPLAGGATTSLARILDAQALTAGLAGFFDSPVTATAGGLIKSRSISGYVQGTFHATDTIDLTLGARYQHELRGLEDSYLGALDPGTNNQTTLLTFNPPDLTANQIAPRVALKWAFAENSQVYTSWSRGFQSPTYNSVNFFSAPDPVKGVRVDAYELGVKSALLDHNLQLDAALFYTKEKNVTSAFVSLTSGGVVRFQNVGAAEIKGAEFSGTWVPLPVLDSGLAVTGGATYLHAIYTDFRDGRGFDEATGLAFGPGSLLPARDFSGNRLTRTPKFSSTLGLNQNIPLDVGSLELAVNAYYNSGFYFLAQNSSRYEQSAYSLVDAHATYFYTPWNVELTAFGLNILNKKYVDSQFDVDFGRTDHLAAPRLFGLRLKWIF